MNTNIRNIIKISNTDQIRQNLAKTARQYYLRSLKHNKRTGEIINKPKED